MKIQSTIALTILIIAGALAVYGWTLMRDAFVYQFDPEISGFQWGMFLLGLLLFIAGLAFVGGFIFYRDRKRKRVQRRFRDDLRD